MKEKENLSLLGPLLSFSLSSSPEFEKCQKLSEFINSTRQQRDLLLPCYAIQLYRMRVWRHKRRRRYGMPTLRCCNQVCGICSAKRIIFLSFIRRVLNKSTDCRQCRIVIFHHNTLLTRCFLVRTRWEQNAVGIDLQGN